MFAIVATGPFLLYTMVTPATAVLGLANVALYAGPYARMKWKSTWNSSLGLYSRCRASPHGLDSVWRLALTLGS